MSRPRRSRMARAALGFLLMVAALQLYLFETVLGAVMDGQRGLLPGAFAASLLLTVVALVLAWKIPHVDDAPKS